MTIRKINISYVFIILLFAVAFFSQCAQTASPQGGPRDTIPPILLGVTPPNYTTNFDAKEVIFTFNEYLQLKDVQKEILISPPMVPRPIFSVRGKGIYMRFPPELKLDSNTTYKIDFGKSIQDNNEGNIAKRFEYVFSTGDKIDSLVMSGKLVDASTGADIVNGFVFYYGNEKYNADSVGGDSTIYKGKKLSLARTDSTGNFLATNLKSIPYRVFAILDENGNQEYDLGSDLVGLSNSRFNPETMKEFDVWIDPVKDRIEVSPQLKLELFKETRRVKQKLNEVKRPIKHQLELIFASDSVIIDAISIDSVLKENIIIENNTFNDSIRVWIKDVDPEVKFPDSLKGVIKYYSVDSVGAPKIDSTLFALAFFESKDAKTTADKVAAKFDSIFEQLGKWLKRLFMGKKKKMAIAAAEHRRYVADSLKRMQADSVALVMRADSLLKADSLAQRVAAGLEIVRDSGKVFIPSFSVSTDMSPTKKLYIHSKLPLNNIDTSKISILRLSFKERGEDDFNLEEADKKERVPTVKTKQKYTIVPLKEDITKREIIVDWLPTSEYQITIDKDALQDISGSVNDSLTHKIKTYDPAKFASVSLNITAGAEDNYIVSVLDSTNNVVDVKNIKGSGKLLFDYLPVKKYKLKFVEDKNGNGIQDIGSVIRSIEPERVEIYYPSKGEQLFLTKENWVVEYDITPEYVFYPDRLVKKEEEEIVKEVVKDAKEQVKEVIKDVKNDTKDKVKEVVKSVKESVKDNIKEGVKEVIKEVKESVAVPKE